MSHAEVARAFVRVARESNAREYTSVGRSHVSHWVAGSKPSGRAPLLLCEALSRKLGRNVTLDEVGLPTGLLSSRDILGWRVDTLATLTELGRADVDAERRRVLNAAAYSLAALTLPTDRWWADMADRGHARGASGGRAVGRGDVDAVRDMVSLFSRVDQRRGGGHARTAVVQYLTSDVANFLRGHYSDDALRRDMFSAASELSYLVGWMAFDNGEHNLAQHYFNLAVKLAAEAANPAMAGHVLRAMAHQAIDLGHYRQALDLASASVEGMRYQAAAPRERALVGVVYARALAVNGTPETPLTHSSEPKTISLRQPTEMMSRKGFSFLERPASRTKPHVLSVIPVTWSARPVSFSAALERATPQHSPERTPSRLDIWGPYRPGKVRSKKPVQRGLAPSTQWMVCGLGAPVRSPPRCGLLSRPTKIGAYALFGTWRPEPRVTSQRSPD